MILAQFTHLVANPSALGMFFQEQQTVGFSPLELWHNMGYLAKGVVIILFVMSIWSLAVIIDRCALFQCRPQAVARVCSAGCRCIEGRQVWMRRSRLLTATRSRIWPRWSQPVCRSSAASVSGGAITEDQIESSKRALERSEAIVHAKLKRGLGGLATIGSTAPFIGLFGTVVGILNAFQADRHAEDFRYRRSRRRYL